ncbi:MAG: acyl-CoA desaturase [Chthoniobacterales bacterium]
MSILSPLIRAIDSDHFPLGLEQTRALPEKMEWGKVLPFAVLHLGCLGVIWVGWSPVAVMTCALLYLVRMFFITGIYHRYFCHKAYKTSRPVQFLFALLGLLCVQRGALWWAAVHRHHHAHSDEEVDVHSPRQKGFLWAHIGWMTSSRNFPTDYRLIPDLAKFPELVFLNRFDLIGPVLLAFLTYGLGVLLGAFYPSLHTSGLQMLVWAGFISTVLLFHGTCCINSMAHVWGKPRYDTGDDSRNSFLLALITLGEGWHNNHHRYQSAARQGFYWWEIDPTYYTLRLLSLLGVISDLKRVPESIYAEGKESKKGAPRDH